MNLAKMFLILSIASSLSKHKLENKGSMNFPGMENVIVSVIPQGPAEWNLVLVYLFI